MIRTAYFIRRLWCDEIIFAVFITVTQRQFFNTGIYVRSFLLKSAAEIQILLVLKTYASYVGIVLPVSILALLSSAASDFVSA